MSVDLVWLDAILYLFQQPIVVLVITGFSSFVAIVVSLVLVLRKWGDNL
jgi:hypothetical protein